VQGELVRAPILERNAFQVLRANQNVWGRRVVLYQPVSDKYGCSVPSVFANLRDDEKQRLAVLLLDGGGCSPEQKSVMWQRAGALCIVLATQFQWVADLAAVMSDSTNLDNVTIPLFFVKYDSNWRTPPTVDWGMKLMEEMAAGRNVSVQLDFPDREEITWDLRSGNAKLSAFLK
jgi:hypothetical protein